jgi:hypothetical protein
VVRVRRSGAALPFAPHTLAERSILEAGGFKAYLEQRMASDGTTQNAA